MSSSAPYAIFTEEGVILYLFIQELTKELEASQIVGQKTVSVNLRGGHKVTFTIKANKKKKAV